MHSDICLIPPYIVFKSDRIVFLLLLLMSINVVDIVISTSTHYNEITQINYSEIIQLLEYSTNANVFIKGSHSYRRKRRIHNGLCHSLFPELIVEPKSTYDVSQIIKIARSKFVPISVTS